MQWELRKPCTLILYYKAAFRSVLLDMSYYYVIILANLNTNVKGLRNMSKVIGYYALAVDLTKGQTIRKLRIEVYPMI